MIFSDLYGNEHARMLLARILASGRVPHALLFHGPEGVGKRVVADRFAASLLCERPREDASSCGACATCVRIEHGNHPDVLVTTRLPKDDRKGASDAADPDEDSDDAQDAKGGELRKWILVSQIRELTEHASYAPREGRRRVFVIDPADRMHAESQNALLKTLEEPPGRAVVILVASRPHVLLPTVRSRCFQVGFAPLRPDDLAQSLVSRGIPHEEARSRAALAEGRPGRAITLDLAGLARRRDAVLKALEALAASPRASADPAACAEEIVGDDEAGTLEGLELTTALLRDAARSASGHGGVLHADVAERIAGLGRALGALRAAELAGLADRLRGDLRLNVNRTLLAETLLAAVAGGPVPL